LPWSSHWTVRLLSLFYCCGLWLAKMWTEH
jgi:hypothetical protein